MFQEWLKDRTRFFLDHVTTLLKRIHENGLANYYSRKLSEAMEVIEAAGIILNIDYEKVKLNHICIQQ